MRAGSQCGEDGQDLLRDDRQHLDVDSVELVEAAPRASLSKRNKHSNYLICSQSLGDRLQTETHLSQTREHSSHRLVVETFRAVDDDDVGAETLAQVLGRLRLARASRALGRASSVQVEGGGECDVAAVGEWRDDQTTRVAEVLVSVQEVSVRLSNNAVVPLLKTKKNSLIHRNRRSISQSTNRTNR